MQSTKPPTNPVSQALYAAGYVPIPRLWVTPEDLQLILYIAQAHSEQIKQIKSQAENSKRVRYVNKDAYNYDQEYDDY